METMDLECVVKDKGLLHRASQEAARLDLRARELEDELEGEKKKFKSKEKDIRERIAEMTIDRRKYSLIVTKGVEIRKVPIERRVDRKAKVVRVIRTDTGEEISTQPLEEGPLFEKADEKPEAPKSKKPAASKKRAKSDTGPDSGKDDGARVIAELKARGEDLAEPEKPAPKKRATKKGARK